MGIGDEIMVTGEVRRRLRLWPGRRFAIRDVRGGSRPEHRWNEIWEGNPHIAKPGESFDEWLINCGGNRPYIVAKNDQRWTWKPFGPLPGEIFLTERERSLGQLTNGRIVVQPGIKGGASPGKQWPLAYWTRLCEHLGKRVLQIGNGSEPRIPGVDFLKTASFRDACGVLATARAAVLQEGGLHHAAAALGVPAVVIFGGFISPKVTGYASQKSLFVEASEFPLGCGSRYYCPHCDAAMKSLLPSIVLGQLAEVLNG